MQINISTISATVTGLVLPEFSAGPQEAKHGIASITRLDTVNPNFKQFTFLVMSYKLDSIKELEKAAKIIAYEYEAAEYEE